MTETENKSGKTETARVFLSLPIVITIMAGVLLSILAFAIAQRAADKKFRTQFDKISQSLISTVTVETILALLKLESTAAFYGGSVKVERNEFASFVNSFLRAHPDVCAIGWAPRVYDYQKAEYVTAARTEGLANFDITEESSEGKLIPAANGKEYFPIYYIEPFAKNADVAGFDFASKPILFDALQKALQTGRPAATIAQRQLLAPYADEILFVVFLPLYMENIPDTSESKPTANLAGLVFEFFHISDVISVVQQRLQTEGIDLYVYDETAAAGGQSICYQASGLRQDVVTFTLSRDNLLSKLYYSEQIDFAGRQWLIVCKPTGTYMAQYRELWPWMVLGIGLSLTAIFLSYFAATLMVFMCLPRLRAIAS